MKNVLGITFAGLTIATLLNGCKGYQSHPYTPPSLSESEKATYRDALNAARAETQQCGNRTITLADNQHTLAWSETLYAIAYEHTSDMNRSGMVNKDPNNTGSGTTSDHTAQVQNLGRGSTHAERVRNNDYHPVHIKEIATGDNNATHAGSVQAIITYWLSDPETCKKIMDANVTEFGMAHIHDDQSEHKDYWTIDLAKPAPEDTWL